MSIIEEIKERVSMRDLLDFYGIYPTRGKNNYCCLFHNDTHPSAGITKDGVRFHCFACSVSASIFDVVCQIEKCPLKTAIKKIDSDFGLGLVKDLTHKEKLELARQQKERERIKAEKLAMKKFEQKVLDGILKELNILDECEKLTHLTRGEYRKGEWKHNDLYFFVLERQRWLNWLYETICDFTDKQECEFDYIYGTDKREILEKIKKGEIDV